MDTLQQLLELEEAGWQSLCDGSGSDFYADLMTEGALMILADGVTMTRGEVAEALRYAPPWASFILEEPQLVSVADDVGILVYVGTGFRDEGASFKAVMSSTYIRKASGWRLALYQQTPVSTETD
jgi:hypothetical protein